MSLRLTNKRSRVSWLRIVVFLFAVLVPAVLILNHLRRSGPAENAFAIAFDTTGSSLSLIGSSDRQLAVEAFLGGSKYEDDVLFIIYGSSVQIQRCDARSALDVFRSSIEPQLRRNVEFFLSKLTEACKIAGVEVPVGVTNLTTVDGEKRGVERLDFRAIPMSVWPVYHKLVAESRETCAEARHTLALDEIDQRFAGASGVARKILFVSDFAVEPFESSRRSRLREFPGLNGAQFFKIGEDLRPITKSALDDIRWTQLSLR